MLRKGIAFLLLSIFVLSASMPTIISLIDSDVDISFFLDVNEEESKEKEDSKTKIIELNNPNISLCGLEAYNLMDFYLKNYAKPYLNLVSPPPEYRIL